MQTPFQDNAPLIYGLRIPNQRLAMLTRRVMTLAVLAAIIAIVQQVVTYVKTERLMNGHGQGGVGAMVFNITCVILVPCCGYFGAKKSNQNLTCCFCGCNCLQGTCNILFLLVLLMSWKGLGWIVDNCEPGHYMQDRPPRPSRHGECARITWDQMCPQLHKGYTEEECWELFRDDYVPDVQSAFFVFLVFCIPSVFCQCLSFCWGKELYDVLKQGQVIHISPNNVATVGVPVQPVAASIHTAQAFQQGPCAED